ncbi:MAG TPA: triose-phosphate isomerase [Rhizomicrobium sp.]|nr:triose-phosphate isomerase [Rhizomicrobium sp.]
MRQLIAGNWKMNGLGASLAEIAALSSLLRTDPPPCDVVVCPPATLIARAVALNSGIAIGGQDCHAEASGAFTGDVSAEMLRDAGATAVIVGHSERRQYHGETDAIVAAKARAAWRAGLMAIICIGETEAERDAGDAHDVCARQLDGSIPAGASAANTAIAYEPVWAIGTGRTPTAREIVAMHEHIRNRVATPLRILYGGSVKPSNAREILSLADVDGALVGGASLKAADFVTIVRACRAAV